MANPELGTKRVCPETGRKFYDLNKDPIVSPFTGKEYPLSFFEAIKPEPRAAEKREERTEVVEETETETEETVSLSEVEDEEESDGKNALPDVDEDDDEDVQLEDDDPADTFLEDDEDEEDDMTGIIGGGRDNDDEV